jgi:hypothetical protein
VRRGLILMLVALAAGPVRLTVHGGGRSGWSGRMPEYIRFYARACA